MKSNLLSNADLINLFNNNNMDKTIVYIDQVSKRNVKAEQSIISALKIALIQHKVQPIGLTNALVFYKDLLLSSEIDYYDSQEFPKEIHLSVIKACKSSTKQRQLLKGKTYFRDLLKMQSNAQLQKLSSKFVLLSLEIIQNMANWYPKDYFTENKSMFLLAYEKLKKDGIIFPPVGTFIFMKLSQKTLFLNNFARWKQKLQEQQQQQQINKSKINSKQTSNLNSNINNNAKVDKNQTIKIDLKQQQSKMKQEKESIKNSLMKSNKPQNLQTNISISRQPSYKNKQDNLKEQALKNKQQQNVQYINKNNNQGQKEIIFTYDNNKNQSKLPQNNLSPQSLLKYSTNKQTQQCFELRTSIKKNNHCAHQEEALHKQIVDKVSINNKSLNKNLIENQYKQGVNLQLAKLTKSSFNKDFKSSQKRVSPIKDFLIVETPLKNQKIKRISLPKTQKTQRKNQSYYFSINQMQYQFPMKSVRKKKIQHPYINWSPSKQNAGKTLSQFHEQRRQLHSHTIPSQYTYFFNQLQRSNMQPIKIPLISEYYKPITLSDNVFRKCSLTSYSHTQNSQPFFKNNQINIRLIKYQKFYILSFHNNGNRQIKLHYKNYVKTKYSCIFQLISQSKTWFIKSNQFIDIKFLFKTDDLNFRFLQMSFTVDQYPLQFQLPLTLLDQCQFQNRLNLEFQNDFFNLGIIMKSEAFNMRKESIPPYFKLIKLDFFKQIKAFCTLVLQHLQKDTYNTLNILLVQLDLNYNKYQIHALVDPSIQYNEDFAKVIIQLLTFLLTN